MANKNTIQSIDLLLRENEELRSRLASAEERLKSLHNGKENANIISTLPDQNNEENLQVILNRFYLILSSMRNGVLLLTNENRIEFVNQSFCDIFGINEKPDKLMGLPASEMLDKIKGAYLDPGSAVLRINEIVENHMLVLGEEVAMKSGRTLLRDFIPISVRKKDSGRLWNHIDITERKQVENAFKESEERFRNIIKFAPSVMYVMDIHGTKFLSVNETMCRILGYSRDELISIRPIDLLDEPSQANFRLRIKKRLSGSIIGENIEYRVRKKDGGWIDTLITVGNISFSADIDPNITVIAYDITERKKTEAALRESEKKFRELVKYAPTAIYELDFSTRKFVTVNDALCELSGYTRDELLAIDSLDLLDGESKALFLSRIKGCLNGEKPDENVEYNVIAKDGRIINAVLNMKFNFNEQGIPVGAMVVGHDITQRKQAERELSEIGEALKESEKRFRTLAENIPDMIVRFDKDLRLLYGNEAVMNRTGLPLEFLTGKTAKEYGASSESDRNWEKAAREAISTGKPCRLEQPSIWLGSTRIYDALIVPEKDNSGNVSSIISIARDITEMKLAENTLRESEQKLKYHLENSPLAVIEWDKDFNILQWSTEAERIFGLMKEEVLGVRIDLLNIIYHEDLPLVQKTISRLVSGKELKVISQNRYYDKAGEIIECIWYNSVLLDENGKMSSVMSLVEDVTILKRIEKELLESRESYKELVTNARSMIFKLDNNGKITFINEFALNFFGFHKKELLGKPVLGTIVSEKESTGRALDKMVENIIDDPDKYSINVNENIKKNGEKAWVEWHNKTLYDESGIKSGHLAIGVDITKRKKAEEALMESERKLRSVLDATQESIYMFDRSGLICMSNSTGLSRLKKTNENEVLGHHFSEFMTAQTAKRRWEMMEEVFTKAAPLDFEDERDCRIYHHNFSPVLKDKEVVSVVSYSSDITDRKRNESKLLESEDRFRTIAESLTVMISITRICDSILTFINEPFERTYGFKKAELVEKEAPDVFFSPHDYTKVNDILLINGAIDNMEVKVKKRDGTPFWIMTSTRTINFMGEPSYLTASIDITDTKSAQEELLRLNRTLNAHSKSSHAMMHTTNEYNYLNTVCKIIIEDCGYSMVWVGYAENDKRKSVRPVAFFGFDKGYIDQMNITWDDTDRGRGPTGTAIRTGKPSICKNMQTDPAFEPWKKAALERGYSSSLVLPLITEEKTFGAISIYSEEPDSFSEPEIKLLSELADDLAYGISFLRLTESEREAARIVKKSESKLKELIVTKDKFFNIVAHDLKNPFTSLLGSSELLYDNIDHMSSENIRKLALILNDSAKGGFAILQNLLDWSRSQTGLIKFNPEKINLKIAIDENIDNLQLQVHNKDIILKSELEDELFIIADKNMINTVLRNLLSNAVKYTFKNGTIVVSVLRKPEEITITVKDTGIGISDDKAGVLFKLENSLSLPGTEKEQGTGLGLKLCKEFTERMGGRIWVESTPGKGSKFKFTIPVKD
jgi:PAS domain S-box-containing protein